MNIPPLQFWHGDVGGMVTAVLVETGFDNGGLELELTEGVPVEGPERATIVLDDLKRLGVKLAIDDFGTGYLSLSYLRITHSTY